MSGPSKLRLAWVYIKEYGAAVVAAALMYGGTHQVISALKYPFTSGLLQLVNVVIHRGFPDSLPLPDYSGTIPWISQARICAVGVIVIVVGIMVGLWANVRSERHATS
jgi:hypothetical protein